MLNNPFDTALGKKIYENAERAIADFSMADMLRRGVLVGLSGGADSVLLLYFLCEYRKNNFDFPITALHVNHMIRGEAADADEQFSKCLCKTLGIEFIAVRRDVPSIARDGGIGLEEAARNERYSIFQDIICSRNDVGCVAVAHNATDNIETVVFNMLRGSGIFGMCGIAPVRENVIRPLIYSSSNDIRECLRLAGIGCVTDKTNYDTDYSRNYVRHEIIPKFQKLNPNPENAFTKLSANMRSGCELISDTAKSVLGERTLIKREELLRQNKAVFSEILRLLVKKHTDKMLEAVHIDRIYSLLSGDNFSVSLPGGVSFVCERGVCKLLSEDSSEGFRYDVNIGENDFSDFSAKLFLDFDKPAKTYSKVYNFSIQVAIPFDIIKGGLYIRNRKNGDSYRTSGMTKRVKRMLCDADIPRSVREKIPVLCDDEGILWIPGFRVRDYDKNIGGRTLYMNFVLTDLSVSDRFYFADKRSVYEKV